MAVPLWITFLGLPYHRVSRLTIPKTFDLGLKEETLCRTVEGSLNRELGVQLRSTRANGAIQFLGGVLVIASPYLLGSLADHLGLRAAFAIEPVLIGACAVLLTAGLRLARLDANEPATF